MNDILFSIVVPTYNRAKFIRSTISSVLAQTYTNFEIVVVDDGSTDNTAEIMGTINDPRISYYKKANEERAAARNFGIGVAKGSYVNFLDSDDYVHPNHLAEALRFLQKHPDAKAFHLGYEFRDTAGKVIRVVDDQKPINENIIFGNSLSTNGVFVEKQTLLDNPFNEDRVLSSLEDWELWIRLASRVHFYNIPGVTSVVVQHETRSVMTKDIPAIEAKVSRFIEYVLKDEVNNSKYGSRLKDATASAKTYASLHIAMTGTHKRLSLRYLRDGISDSRSQLFTKRFVVVLMLLLGIKRPK